jgi:hypothetical protein
MKKVLMLAAMLAVVLMVAIPAVAKQGDMQSGTNTADTAGSTDNTGDSASKQGDQTAQGHNATQDENPTQGDNAWQGENAKQDDNTRQSDQANKQGDQASEQGDQTVQGHNATQDENPTQGDNAAQGDNAKRDDNSKQGANAKQGAKDNNSKHHNDGDPHNNGGATEVTQNNQQDIQSGDSAQTIGVTGGGDNSNQCAGGQGVSNTGNSTSATSVTRVDSDQGDVQVEDSGNFEASPTSTTTCKQQVDQAASASGSLGSSRPTSLPVDQGRRVPQGGQAATPRTK